MTEHRCELVESGCPSLGAQRAWLWRVVVAEMQVYRSRRPIICIGEAAPAWLLWRPWNLVVAREIEGMSLRGVGCIALQCPHVRLPNRMPRIEAPIQAKESVESGVAEHNLLNGLL